ncbi:hypothetical protein [Pseudomonas syringae]|uniref:hypothetical protein n=1 Tax=Pseudomonas syringae TaxID=317 RepID=UPI001E602490|nr:hypothetical protein [Pseudomonas syringae]UZS73906.1 hypothetical protein OQB66_06140 [Pseudomonas syringae]
MSPKSCVSSKASVISSDSFRASYTNSPEASSVHQRARTPRCGELQGPQVSRLMPCQQALVGVARWPDPHFNSLLSRGTVVPLVFGFEKVKGLSAHEISTSIPGKNNRFMY